MGIKIGSKLEVFKIGICKVVGFSQKRPLVEHPINKYRFPVVRMKYKRVGGGSFDGYMYFRDAEDKKYSTIPKRRPRRAKIKTPAN